MSFQEIEDLALVIEVEAEFQSLNERAEAEQAVAEVFA